MKLLLTSAGITNDELASELERLSGKRFDQLKIAFIPTAALCDTGDKGWLIQDLYRLHDRGAKVDIVDVAQLPRDQVRGRLEWADVIFVGGGNTFYISYWAKESGLKELLEELLRTRVYVGISAGSMITSSTIRTSSQAYKSEHFYDESYEEFGPKGHSSTETFKWVNFAFRPHLNSRFFPEVTQEKMQHIATALAVDMYVVDDNTAVVVEGQNAKVVGGGEWYNIKP